MTEYELFVEKVKDSISKRLFNFHHTSETNPTSYLEQYRMQVDSSAKTDERRGAVNNFFITINGIFLPFLIQAFPLGTKEAYKLIMLFILVFIGLLISYEWLFIIKLYKRLNYINYEIIKTIEENLPCHIFSVKADVLAKHTDSQKANVFLERETFLPKTFFFIFLGYFILSVGVYLFS